MHPEFKNGQPSGLSSGVATISFPTSAILLVTLSRPEALNAITAAGHMDLHNLYSWYDNEPKLRCAILTGSGRAFCAGADLKEWLSIQQSGEAQSLPASGFGGLSRRSGVKPIICAVNGLCLGGGFEMALNADMILASSSATFGLPEVKRGVAAIGGVLPRLPRAMGKQRAMEMALTGRTVSAREMREWGVLNRVMLEDEDLVAEAVKIAEVIAENSPDGVVVSKRGIDLGWSGKGVEEGSDQLLTELGRWLQSGENIEEGLKAFSEKRRARWKDLRSIPEKSKL